MLFIEKEGFDDLFDAVQLRERYDLAIMSTKGMSVTAARELVDGYGQAGIPVFVLHDFDKSGLSIAHTLGTSSRRYTFQQPPTPDRSRPPSRRRAIARVGASGRGRRVRLEEGPAREPGQERRD